MRRCLKFLLIPIAISGVSFLPLSNKAEGLTHSGTGEKGAKIYCFMRNNGNNHEVSWNASYALIKRQTNSLFKTSPKHAAVMIIESVVQNPDKYENCGNYLGDLFGGDAIINQTEVNETEVEIETNEKPPKSSVKDRYNY